jgi:tetratricopeptide (TPR) repeat protein
MANEAHIPTVLIAHFPETGARDTPTDERLLIGQVLTGGMTGGEIAIFEAGVAQQGVIPVVANEGFSPAQVNLLHLSGRPFPLEEVPIGDAEQQAQIEALRMLTDSILHYPELQVVVLSGCEHEELVRQLLLTGVPMVLSLRHGADLPEQIEAFYSGLAAGQSVRQTLEMLVDAYPEWDLGFHEVNYDPEREVLHWDANRYPDGPNWTHGLVYRETQWRSLTWRLRNPLVIPLSERRRWERRSAGPRRPTNTDPSYSPLLSTMTREGEEQAAAPQEELEVRGHSRALRRGAQKSRELRERESKRQQQQQRNRTWWVIGAVILLITLIGIPLGMREFNRGQEQEASLSPCPFPPENDAYRVLLLPFKQTPTCAGGAAYLTEELGLALKALRKKGFKIDLRYQPIDACPLSEEVVNTTAELCYADLVVWGNLQQEAGGATSRLLVNYQTTNQAGEQIFLTGASLHREIVGEELPYADSLLQQDLISLVLWARAYRHYNQEEYDQAIRTFLAIDQRKRAVQSLVTQMLTRSYVQAGRYEQAREYFGRLIDMHPEESGYYLDRANMLSQMEEPLAALSDLNQVLQLEPDNITAQVRRAKVYEQLGEYDQALADMNDVLEAAPDLPALHCRRAEIHRARGDDASAEADYNQALTLDSTYAEAHYGLGLLYQAQGEGDAALVAVDAALRHDPTLIDAGLFRADVLARQGRWQAAANAYTQVLAQQASAEAYTRRGQAYEALEQPDLALADYKQATDLKPTHTPAWMGRGRLYAETQRYEAAMADLNRVLEQQPRHVDALRLRAEVRLIRKEWDGALEDLSLLVKESPTDQQAYFFRATALLEKGQANEASRMANLARAMGAGSDQFHLLEARIALAQQRPDTALIILNQVVKQQPSWGEAFHFRGLAQLQLGHDAEAQADLETSTRMGGEQINTYLKLGEIYEDAGRFVEAKTAYVAFIERHPERAEGYLSRGHLYQTLFRFDSALADYNRGLSLDPQADRQYLLARGEVKTELGSYNQALVDFNQVIRQQPDELLTYCLRGKLYQKMGNPSKAEMDLRYAIKLAPASSMPWYYLGNIYRDQGNQQQALEAINQALRLDSSFASGYNLRGELWVELEVYDRAVADFNHALRLDPGHADAYDNRADLARQAGDYARAIENYSLALTHNPRHADALYQRGFIYALQDQYEDAINDIRTSLDIRPGVGIRYGSLAQIYARERLEEPFFHYLQLALDHGYPLSELEHDPAFRNYREHPRFRQIMNAYGQ